MSIDKHPLSQKEFWEIYKKVPRLTVEIILKNEKGVYLTLRNIDPCKGLWHLPGGTVRFGEPLIEAIQRIAKRELGIEVIKTNLLGYIEYPSHYLNDLDCPIGLAFQITQFDGGLLLNSEASNSGWFKELPDNMHDEQRDFLNRNAA